MTKVLTAVSVAKLRGPEKGCREIPDGGSPGLYLQLFASGKKSWALRYRRPASGKPAKLTLGSVDADSGPETDIKPVIGGHLSLRSAHRLAAKLKHEIALGRDPGVAHIAAKRQVLNSDKFGGAALDFIEQHAKRKTRRWQDTARLLGLRAKADGDGLETIPNGLADRWRDKPVAEIDGDTVHAVVDLTREKGIPGLARHKREPSEARARSMYAALSTMFGWLISKRRLKQNPCIGVHRPETPKDRDRVLTDQEVIRFWAACQKVSEPFGQLLKMLLLTGARLREISEMRRSELSDDGSLLTIPATRTKNHRSHTIPLSQMARDILASVKTEGDLVFTTTGTSPVSGWSKTKKKLDEATDISAWRLHDLRRTAATGMAEIGIAPHIVEACLNHISGAKAGVAGVYNRATYAPEKKAALERWADHVEGLMSRRSANVTPIRKNGM